MNEMKNLEFLDFSLILPVSTRFTNYFGKALKKYCARRKHRIKILKTIRPRYHNDLGGMVAPKSKMYIQNYE